MRSNVMPISPAAPRPMSQRPLHVEIPPSKTRVSPYPRATIDAIAMTTRVAGSMDLLPGLRRAGVRLDDDGGAVGDDLGHRVVELGAVEPHADDGVGAHERCVRDHSVEGLTAGVLEKLGVLVDFASDEGAQGGTQVPGQASAPNDDPEDLSVRLGESLAGHEWRCGDDHAGSMPVNGGRGAPSRGPRRS